MAASATDATPEQSTQRRLTKEKALQNVKLQAVDAGHKLGQAKIAYARLLRSIKPAITHPLESNDFEALLLARVERQSQTSSGMLSASQKQKLAKYEAEKSNLSEEQQAQLAQAEQAVIDELNNKNGALATQELLTNAAADATFDASAALILTITRVCSASKGAHGVVRAISKNMGDGSQELGSGTEAMEAVAGGVFALSAAAIAIQCYTIGTLLNKIRKGEPTTQHDRTNLAIHCASLSGKLARTPALLSCLGKYGVEFAGSAGDWMKGISAGSGAANLASVSGVLGLVSVILVAVSAYQLKEFNKEVSKARDSRNEALVDCFDKTNYLHTMMEMRTPKEKAAITNFILRNQDIPENMGGAWLELKIRGYASDNPTQFLAARQQLYEAQKELKTKQNTRFSLSRRLIAQTLIAAATIVSIVFPPAALATIGIIAAVSLANLLFGIIKKHIIDPRAAKEFDRDYQQFSENIASFGEGADPKDLTAESTKELSESKETGVAHDTEAPAEEQQQHQQQADTTAELDGEPPTVETPTAAAP